MSKLLKDIAYGLGARARQHDKPKIPAKDEILLESCLKDCQIGEGSIYIYAWLKGWDDVNLGRI